MVSTVGFRQNKESCVFLASINLNVEQRDTLKDMRVHISDYCDLLLDAWHDEDSTYFDWREAVEAYRGTRDKSVSYIDFCIKAAMTHLNFLHSINSKRIKHDLIPGIYFPTYEVKINSDSRSLIFPKGIGLTQGGLNNFPFKVLNSEPKKCINYVKIMFSKGKGNIFCELETRPININWTEMTNYGIKAYSRK